MIDSKDKDYYSLPTKVSNQTLMLLDRNFKAFFSKLRKKKEGSYGKPVKLPKYLEKEGRYIAIFYNRGCIKSIY